MPSAKELRRQLCAKKVVEIYATSETKAQRVSKCVLYAKDLPTCERDIMRLGLMALDKKTGEHPVEECALRRTLKSCLANEHRMFFVKFVAGAVITMLPDEKRAAAAFLRQ